MKKIRISNNLIINKNFPHKAFLLLIKLKQKAYDGTKIRIKVETLMYELKWKDRRQIKKYLNILYDFGLINIKIGKMTSRKPLEFEILDNPKKNYTQIGTNVINKTIECASKIMVKDKNKMVERNMSHMAVRLLYYYAMLLTNKVKKVYPTYEEIYCYTKINKRYIYFINKNLEENGLIKIKYGGYYVKLVKENDTIVTFKERNEYVLTFL